MPECSNEHCTKKQSRLNPGELCQTCYANVQVNDDENNENPLENIDLDKPIGQTNLRDIVDIIQALTTPIVKKIDNLDDSIMNRITNYDAKIALLEANNKEKDMK